MLSFAAASTVIVAPVVVDAVSSTGIGSAAGGQFSDENVTHTDDGATILIEEPGALSPDAST